MEFKNLRSLVSNLLISIFLEYNLKGEKQISRLERHVIWEYQFIVFIFHQL